MAARRRQRLWAFSSPGADPSLYLCGSAYVVPDTRDVARSSTPAASTNRAELSIPSNGVPWTSSSAPRIPNNSPNLPPVGGAGGCQRRPPTRAPRGYFWGYSADWGYRCPGGIDNPPGASAPPRHVSRLRPHTIERALCWPILTASAPLAGHRVKGEARGPIGRPGLDVTSAHSRYEGATIEQLTASRELLNPLRWILREDQGEPADRQHDPLEWTRWV
ncbi:hypothetical protein LuPra_01720 [Luteitalea pratensis]|uniref:Uncharacterized protein n=1 Tax=Luteitalea pratensis TaxID=1855912 RepID=A0A143PL74_LUTPR|nr:hypothetical protein LuPra_01720 [Luteitalea pratensis]